MKEQNFWFYNLVGSVIWAASINLLGIFFIDNYQVILDNLGKVMTVFLIGTIAYFYFFKKEFIQTYMRDKQNEINERIEKERIRKQ